MRVKSLHFLDQEAIAIYFYDITSQVESMMNQNRLRFPNIISGAARVGLGTHQGSPHLSQGDFCEPLTSSLMFLESALLNQNLVREVRQVIVMVVS